MRRRQIEITGIIAAELQPLAAVGEVGDQRRGALVGTGLLQAVEDDAFHSTRSTKTFTVPPQASPTSQACSSEPQNSSSLGGAPAMIACASCTNAPSMQPPETGPCLRIRSSPVSVPPPRRGRGPPGLPP